MPTRPRRSKVWLAIVGALAAVAALGVSTLLADKGSKKVTWTDVARLSKLSNEKAVAEAQKQLASRPNQLQQRAEPVLDDMASTSPDAAGIRRARARLAAALPGFADPKSKTAGVEPNVGAVQQCALVLYHGLVRRAGLAAKALPHPDEAAVALVDAVRGIEGFREGLVRDLLDELAEALGDALYDRATAALDSKTKK